MQRLIRFAAPLAGTIVLIAVFAVAPAQAAFIMKISDGSTTVTSTDGSAAIEGFYFISASEISFNSSTASPNPFTAYAVTIASGFTNPIIGSLSDVAMDLLSLSVKKTSAGSGILTIELTTTYQTLPTEGPPNLGELFAALGGTATGGATVKLESWYDQSNGAFTESGSPPAVVATDPLVVTPPAGGVTSSKLVTLLDSDSNGTSDPFSLTMKITMTFTSSGSFTSSNAEAHVITPEPATLTLWGLGLLAVGGRRFVRRRRIAA